MKNILKLLKSNIMKTYENNISRYNILNFLMYTKSLYNIGISNKCTKLIKILENVKKCKLKISPLKYLLYKKNYVGTSLEIRVHSPNRTPKI